MAFCASWSELISTKANPRPLPVIRSWTTLTDTTLPACAKRSCSSFSRSVNERLPPTARAKLRRKYDRVARGPKRAADRRGQGDAQLFQDVAHGFADADDVVVGHLALDERRVIGVFLEG